MRLFERSNPTPKVTARRWPARLAAVCIIVGVATPRATRAAVSSLESLGGYERQAVTEVLVSRSYEIDPDPEGKQIANIHVVNLDVFAKSDGRVRVFNALHVTTRPDAIEQELLVRPGDLWDDQRLDETARKLRDPLFSTLVVLLPVRAEGEREREVDLLVVTRDVWSLRTNSDFEVQAGTLTKLYVLLAENNLFGFRKQLGVEFDMDMGKFSVGPSYMDPNIAGTRFQLLTTGGPNFNRDTGAYEGTSSRTKLSYPLWSLDRSWAFGVDARHSNSVDRVFQGTELLEYELVDPMTGDVESAPREYRHKWWSIGTEVLRSFGTDYKHHVALGHAVRAQRPELLDGFMGSETLRAAFEADVLPRSELTSALVARYRFFTPAYRTYRNLDTYDLTEDRRIGPDASVEVAVASRAFGSEVGFVRLTGNAEWTFDLGEDALLRARGWATGRFEGDGPPVDSEVGGQLIGASPALFDTLRVVAHANVRLRARDRENTLLIAGGQSGLRGYPVGAYTGSSRVVTNLEVRTMPRKLWFTRIGALAFWDMGHAAESADALRMHHDVGVGIRLLAPQTGLSIYRFDWAFPFNGEAPGWPGRITIGYEQVF